MIRMSETAIENDKKLGVPLVEVETIMADSEFNCRGYFSASTCVQLAQDIAQRGLQAPVMVRSLREKPFPELGLGHEQNLINKGFKYKMIAGHRRLMAYKINEANVIPCIIKQSNIQEFEEHDLNAIENLQRSELNFQQEANAIRHYWMAGWAREDIATKIGKSPGWVQSRVILLELPKEVQELAGQGYIKSSDMSEISKFRKGDINQLLAVVAKIRDKRKAGEKNIMHRIKKKDKVTTKKNRTRVEIFEMMEHLQEILKKSNRDITVSVKSIVSPYGNTFGTRLLGWATGEVSTGEIYDDIAQFCELIGIEYKKPEFDEI